jgi:hypothetical protein
VCLIVLNAFSYKTQYEFCKFHVRNGKLRGWETCVVKGTLQIGIRDKVSTSDAVKLQLVWSMTTGRQVSTLMV